MKNKSKKIYNCIYDMLNFSNIELRLSILKHL